MSTLTIKVKHPEYGDEVEIMADSIYCAHEYCSEAPTQVYSFNVNGDRYYIHVCEKHFHEICSNM